MGKLIRKIWSGIKRLFNKVEDATKELIPIAIKIVEGVKKVMDSPVDDVVLSIITEAIPGKADDILIEKITKFVEKELPGILLELRLIDSIAGIDDPNEQLKAILNQFKFTSDSQKNEILHSLASLTLDKLSDGDFSWSDSVVVAEFYYKNILNK